MEHKNKSGGVRPSLFGNRISLIIKDSAVEESTRSLPSITVSPKKSSTSSLLAWPARRQVKYRICLCATRRLVGKTLFGEDENETGDE